MQNAIKRKLLILLVFAMLGPAYIMAFTTASSRVERFFSARMR